MKIKVDTTKLLTEIELLAAVYRKLQQISDNLLNLGNKKDWDDIYDGIAEHIKYEIWSYQHNVSNYVNVCGKFSKFIETSCNRYNQVDSEIGAGKGLGVALNSGSIGSLNMGTADKMQDANNEHVASVKISGMSESENETNIPNLSNVEEVKVKAVEWAIGIANDDTYGYSQSIEHRGIDSYDCSSLVCSAYKKAGADINPLMNTTAMVKDGCAAMISAGFVIVTSEVNLSTGEGLQEGDILLTYEEDGNGNKIKGHTEMVTKVEGGKVKITGAHSDKDGKFGDGGGREIDTRDYHYGATGYEGVDKWNYVLRYEKK